MINLTLTGQPIGHNKKIRNVRLCMSIQSIPLKLGSATLNILNKI